MAKIVDTSYKDCFYGVRLDSVFNYAEAIWLVKIGHHGSPCIIVNYEAHSSWIVDTSYKDCFPLWLARLYDSLKSNGKNRGIMSVKLVHIQIISMKLTIWRTVVR